MIDHIKVCDNFVLRLQLIEDVNNKRTQIYQADDFIDSLLWLQKNDKLQFDRIIEDASDQFPRSKTAITNTLKDILKDKKKKASQENISDFTDADTTGMATKSGQIIPTVDSLCKILLAAKKITIVFDKMSHETYFSKIDWEPHDAIVEIPMIGSDNKKVYHPYTSSTVNQTGLQQSLNRGPFAGEIAFSKLEKSVELISRSNEVDFCQEWLDSCESHFDGVDRFTGDNNYLVKYCGIKKGSWADACARIFLLAIVTRIKEPGWPLRYYFAFEGEQNVGKSKIGRFIVPEQWYTSKGLDSDNLTEFYRATYNKVIIELAEKVGNASVETFKRLNTENHSEFRPLYSPNIKHAKRSIIILTTNEYEYLRDPTGATRCIPIRSLLHKNEFFNWEGLGNDLPKLYAQAYDMYKRGDRPYLTPEEIMLQEQETAKREMLQNTWEYEVVERYLELDNNRDKADKYGLCTQLIYDQLLVGKDEFGKSSIGVTEYQLKTKHGRAFGTAFIMHGYTEKGKRYCNHPDMSVQNIGTHQMWWKPGNLVTK